MYPDSGGMDNRRQIAPGCMVDHFKVLRALGRGGMAEVYLAEDTRLERKVALKVIQPELLGSKETLKRFVLEARMTARFNHPHIVAIHFVGTYGSLPYLALEYLEGQSLRARLRQGAIEPTQAFAIALAIAEALETAHAAGVLHRDLKPENVFLPRDGRLRVLDFGMAKMMEGAENLVRTTVSMIQERGQHLADFRESTNVLYFSEKDKVCGTPPYMAPEQWLGLECSTATDIWAFGVVLFEIVTGHRPFPGTTASELCPRVIDAEPMPQLDHGEASPGVIALVGRCLDKHPDSRPTAGDLVVLLRQVVRGMEQSTVQLKRSPETPTKKRGGARLLAVGIGLVVLIATVTVAILLARVPGTQVSDRTLEPTAMTAAAPDQGSWVEIAIEVTPRESQVFLDGQLRVDRLLRLPARGSKMKLRIEAEGYTPVVVPELPRSSQKLRFTLSRLAAIDQGVHGQPQTVHRQPQTGQSKRIKRPPRRKSPEHTVQPKPGASNPELRYDDL